MKLIEEAGLYKLYKALHKRVCERNECLASVAKGVIDLHEQSASEPDAVVDGLAKLANRARMFTESSFCVDGITFKRDRGDD